MLFVSLFGCVLLFCGYLFAFFRPRSPSETCWWTRRKRPVCESLYSEALLRVCATGRTRHGSSARRPFGLLIAAARSATAATRGGVPACRRSRGRWSSPEILNSSLGVVCSGANRKHVFLFCFLHPFLTCDATLEPLCCHNLPAVLPLYLYLQICRQRTSSSRVTA